LDAIPTSDLYLQRGSANLVSMFRLPARHTASPLAGALHWEPRVVVPTTQSSIRMINVPLFRLTFSVLLISLGGVLFAWPSYIHWFAIFLSIPKVSEYFVSSEDHSKHLVSIFIAQDDNLPFVPIRFLGAEP
jgi:hypothetical protein